MEQSQNKKKNTFAESVKWIQFKLHLFAFRNSCEFMGFGVNNAVMDYTCDGKKVMTLFRHHGDARKHLVKKGFCSN